MNKPLRLRVCAFIFSFSLMSISVTAPASSETAFFNEAKIQSINELIRQKGAKWKAKENRLSRLSEAEMKQMLGSNSIPKPTLDFETTTTTHGALDWRNKDGFNWLGPIMNQGNCASCVAYSTAATLEAQISISAGLPWFHPTFSADQLNACGGGDCHGWYANEAAVFVKNKGVVDVACAPLAMPSTGEIVSCGDTTKGCIDPESRTFKVLGFTQPSDGTQGASIDQVKAALANGPLETTLAVYGDLFTYDSGIYQHVGGGAPVGGHAVSIIGYDDDGRYWIVRNSWGPTWGENGFMRVSWDDVSGVGSETWQFQVPAANQYLSVQSPQENEYISGQYSARIQSNLSNAVQLEVRPAGEKSGTPVPCIASGNGCVSTLDTSKLPDGRYEIVAKSQAEKVFSQVRSFYVANQVPTNLSLTVVGEVDLTQPLKGRPVFDITTTSAPNPLEDVTFYVRQNGKVMAQRKTAWVLNKMKFGFHTDSLPDGDYEIQFIGSVHGGNQLYTVSAPAIKVTFKNYSK